METKNYLVVTIRHVEAESEEGAIEQVRGDEFSYDGLVQEEAYDFTVLPGEELNAAIERTRKSL